MSDTPRTDAAFVEAQNKCVPDQFWPAAIRMRDLARQLERELSAARRELSAHRTWLFLRGDDLRERCKHIAKFLGEA